MTLVLLNVFLSGNTSNPCGWGQKPRCALGHVEEISSDHLNIMLLLILSVRVAKQSFSISHISSHFEGICPYHMPHVTSYYIYNILVYTITKLNRFKKPPFRSHQIHRSYAKTKKWKCQESQKDLPLLSRTHFLCMATTAKMALLQVKKTWYLEVFGSFRIFLYRISK